MYHTAPPAPYTLPRPVGATLARLPDTQVPEQTIEFPPLPGEPAQESFTGPLKPIPPFKLPKSAD